MLVMDRLHNLLDNSHMFLQHHMSGHHNRAQLLHRNNMYNRAPYIVLEDLHNPVLHSNRMHFGMEPRFQNYYNLWNIPSRMPHCCFGMHNSRNLPEDNPVDTNYTFRHYYRSHPHTIRGVEHNMEEEHSRVGEHNTGEEHSRAEGHNTHSRVHNTHSKVRSKVVGVRSRAAGRNMHSRVHNKSSMVRSRGHSRVHSKGHNTLLPHRVNVYDIL